MVAVEQDSEALISVLHDLSGTLRARNTQDTWEWLQPKMKALGITRVANITGLDHIGIPVATCVRPASKHLSVSQGKGISLELAKISAVMESIEGYHIENPPTALLTGSYHALRATYRVIDPRVFYAADVDCVQMDDCSFEWIEAINLVTQQTHYVPRVLSYIDTTRYRKGYAWFKVSSNGLAAGNTVDEALCHALYEVIERDSLACWQRLSDEARKQTQVNVDSLPDTLQSLLVQPIRQANISIKLWEITSAVGLPAYHCALYDNDAVRRLGLFTGTGAHWSARIAISRAITEAVQSRLAWISGNRDDIFPEYYRRMSEPLPEQILPGEREYQQCFHPVYADNLKAQSQQLVDRLKEKNYKEILMVNHTQASIQVPVVQVLVPGLLFNSARAI